MFVIIDNYDSFTYNIFQYLSELTESEIRVIRNDKISIEELEALNPQGIIISPGPGRPEDAGISEAVIRHFMKKVPILGVCLGHQAIGHIFGGKIINSPHIMHGKVVKIDHDSKGLFRNVPNKIEVTRYNSLVVEPGSFSPELEVTALDENGEIMGLRHKEYPLEGVQFHPESIASESGYQILKNFLKYKRNVNQIKDIYKKILDRKDLTVAEAEDFADELTDGAVAQELAAGILTGLNMKGYTADEIIGVSKALRNKSKKIYYDQPLLDTCGTGGDGFSNFNISSFAAIVTSSLGIKTAKHGNRSVSSNSGSSDFFHSLGMDIEADPLLATEYLDQANFCFLFAPVYHCAMKNAAGVRKALGVKTIFNLAGPLSNPAGAKYQLIGVYDQKLARIVAEAASSLGVERILVVHGFDGSDEISVTGPTHLTQLIDGVATESVLELADYGISHYELSDLSVDDSAQAVAIARELAFSNGKPANRKQEAIFHSVCLNSGAGIYIAGQSCSILEGYKMAREGFSSGKVAETLIKLRDLRESQRIG
ncbi:MAG: anthranilate phosphoribosyltransferase [Spirochaetales bacterium]|nr:anthranilate phosphoribosyltransferase [Spirochaetales bacterium]